MLLSFVMYGLKRSGILRNQYHEADCPFRPYKKKIRPACVYL